MGRAGVAGFAKPFADGRIAVRGEFSARQHVLTERVCERLTEFQRERQPERQL